MEQRAGAGRRDAGPAAGAADAGRNYTLLLITVSLGAVLAPLNSTMLAVALPEIRREFSVGHVEIAWLVSAYLIAMAVAQPLGGRLGDQMGRAPVFRVGLISFLVLSLAAAFAPSFPVLIFLRTGQALVGAAVIPNGMAMLRESVPLNRLGRYIGINGSVVSISAAVGPLIGAGLLAVWSWRLLFLMNVPLVAAGLLAVMLLRYQDRPRAASVVLDWPGALIFAALLTAMTLLLNALKGGESDAVLIAGMVAFPLFLVLFFHRQVSASSPIAEWRLFRNRSYAGATAYILLSNLVMYTTLLSIPFFIEEVQGRSSLVSGLLLGAISIPVAAAAPVGGRVSDSLGRQPPVLAGSVLVVAASLALLVAIDPGVSYWLLGGLLLLLGVGLGLSVGPSNAAAVESSPRELAGAAAGTNSMMRYIGSIVGAGILGAVLNTQSGAAPGIGLFQLIFAVLVVMSVLGSLASLFIHRFAAERPELTVVTELRAAAAPGVAELP